METLKSFLDQSLLIWKDSTAAARFGISLLLLIFFGAIIGVGIWSSQPEYVQLAAELDPGKVTKLIDALEAADIKYEQKGASSVWVDKRNRTRAQNAASRLGIGQMSSERIQTSPWDPMDAQKDASRVNLQLDLKRMVEEFDAVDEATVLLGNPERQPFLRRHSEPTASVSLKLVPNSGFDGQMALSIASTIAAAVPDLTPERVSITDTEGNQYTTDPTHGRMNKREEYRIRRENELAEKAERLLYSTLGFGNYTVAVTTEFSFPEGKTTSIELDSKNKVVVKETVNSNMTTADNRSALGPAGVVANNGTAPPRQSAKETISKQEDSESEYRVPETTKTEIIDTPVMERMSVSVVVNSTKLAADNQPIPAETIASYENLLRQAVGFRDDKDEFKLEFMPFVERAPVEAPSPFITLPWEKINQILKNLSLGLAALVALFVAFKALKRIQPDPSLAQEANDRGSQVMQLSDLVKQNPEVFSKIIESWSSLDSKKANDETIESKAA